MDGKMTNHMSHAFHIIENTEAGKQAIHSVGLAAVAAISVAPALVIAVAPFAVVGAAAWGMWKLFRDA
jgi:hypothetical protein